VTFEAAVRAPGVRLLIIGERGGVSGLWMTRELRRESTGWDLRLPGGKVFDSLAEFRAVEPTRIAEYALASAEREGREEAGLHSGIFHALEVSHAGASVDWDLYYFAVRDPVMAAQELEDSEMGNISVEFVSREEIRKALLAGQVQEGRSAAVLWRWMEG
jgi:NUDIX domain